MILLSPFFLFRIFLFPHICMYLLLESQWFPFQIPKLVLMSVNTVWTLRRIDRETKYPHKAQLREFIQRAHKSQTSEGTINLGDFALMRRLSGTRSLCGAETRGIPSRSAASFCCLCAARLSETGDSPPRCQVQGLNRTEPSAHYPQPVAEGNPSVKVWH